MDKNNLNRSYTGGAVDGNISDYINVYSGVPQGIVLGPRLFMYYINAIPIGLKFTLQLFADDLISYMTVSNTPDAETVIADLDKLTTWEQKWKMVFHPEKCHVISISRKR